MPWTFHGETLFLQPRGRGRQGRWFLHCPSLHLDVGKSKRNGIIGKARLSRVYLWQYDSSDALSLVWEFLQDFHSPAFTLHVSEVHLCAGVKGWDLSLDDATVFISR